LIENLIECTKNSDERVSAAAVVEEDDFDTNTVLVVTNDRYGLDWKDLSCSFDSVLTVLLYLFLSLSLELRREFIDSTPVIGNIFKIVDISSKDSIAYAKILLMELFMSGVKPKFAVQHMLSRLCITTSCTVTLTISVTS
jgi:hypothetical protein